MSETEQQIKPIKIAIIDSGIDRYFSVFLPNNKEVDKAFDWGSLQLEDTIIRKATGFCNSEFEKVRDKLDKSHIDLTGHGTTVAAVAAGRKVEIKLQDTYPVTIEGEATAIELYSYKVLWQREPNFHPDEKPDMMAFVDIVEAFEAAIKDGVDVISISLGHQIPKLTSPYHLDAVAVGSYLAMKANILTVASCSNEGPDHGTVKSTAPWILTVGASLSDKRFVTTVEIDNEKFEGSSFNPSETKWRPLIDFPRQLTSSRNLKSIMHSPVTIKEIRELLPKDTKRLEKILKGKFVCCKDMKEVTLADSAKRILFTREKLKPYAKIYEKPSVWLTCEVAEDIRKKIERTSPIMAKICRSEMVENLDPFIVADFSGRGPNPITNEILKPDICAPGVEICVPHLHSDNLDDYTIVSGTSYSCPFVARKAAIIKREFEQKLLYSSPSRTKSAFMTTAHNPPEKLDVFATGAGFLNFEKARNPGLVYDCNENDFADFLYGQGVDDELKEIYKHTGTRKKIKPWELNYPSITVVVPSAVAEYSLCIPRRITHVGTSSGDFKAQVESKTAGIEIEVKPSQLNFKFLNHEQQFSVMLKVDKELWKSGEHFITSLVWANNDHIVRSPIAIIKEEAEILKLPSH